MLPLYDPWSGMYLGPVTYGHLDAALRSLGFDVREPEPGTRVYTHAPSRAMLTFPILPPPQRVRDHHLAAARMILDAFGVADPSVFGCRLAEAVRAGRRKRRPPSNDGLQ